jgi:hypothetical protein
MLTEKREKGEDEASFHATANLVDPEIVKGHPTGLVLNARRLHIVPERRMFHVLVTKELD